MDETDALEDETYMIIGAIEVLNRLGHGIHEKPYENALMIELGLREIRCEQQTRFDVIYKTIKVGEDVPDLIAAGAHLQLPLRQVAVGSLVLTR